MLIVTQRVRCIKCMILKGTLSVKWKTCAL